MISDHDPPIEPSRRAHLGAAREYLKTRVDGLRDMSGTTIAVTSLAVLGAAAVISAPVWLWLRTKRRYTDRLAGTPPDATPVTTARVTESDGPGSGAERHPADAARALPPRRTRREGANTSTP